MTAEEREQYNRLSELDQEEYNLSRRNIPIGHIRKL